MNYVFQYLQFGLIRVMQKVIRAAQRGRGSGGRGADLVRKEDRGDGVASVSRSGLTLQVEVGVFLSDQKYDTTWAQLELNIQTEQISFRERAPLWVGDSCTAFLEMALPNKSLQLTP